MRNDPALAGTQVVLITAADVRRTDARATQRACASLLMRKGEVDLRAHRATRYASWSPRLRSGRPGDGREAIMTTLLYVEDDDDNAFMLTQRLRRHGIEVRHVESGEKALLSVAWDPPDAVLLDINLPGIDGLTVLRRLRAEPVTRSPAGHCGLRFGAWRTPWPGGRSRCRCFCRQADRFRAVAGRVVPVRR